MSFYLGQKSRFLLQKSDFCHTTPILVNDPFVAFGVTVHFPPWNWFFNFTFQSYSCFRKKSGWRLKKSSPSPLWGHRLPVTALAPSARGLDKSWNGTSKSGVQQKVHPKLLTWSAMLSGFLCTHTTQLALFSNNKLFSAADTTKARCLPWGYLCCKLLEYLYAAGRWPLHTPCFIWWPHGLTRSSFSTLFCTTSWVQGCSPFHMLIKKNVSSAVFIEKFLSQNNWPTAFC